MMLAYIFLAGMFSAAVAAVITTIRFVKHVRG